MISLGHYFLYLVWQPRDVSAANFLFNLRCMVISHVQETCFEVQPRIIDVLTLTEVVPGDRWQIFIKTSRTILAVVCEMLFKLSNLNSNLALTLGYPNPASNNSSLLGPQSTRQSKEPIRFADTWSQSKARETLWKQVKWSEFFDWWIVDPIRKYSHAKPKLLKHFARLLW